MLRMISSNAMMYLMLRRDDVPDDDVPGAGGAHRSAAGVLPHGPRLLRLHLVHVHLRNGVAGEQVN